LRLQERLDAFTSDLIASGKIPASLVKELMEGIGEQVSSGRSEHALKAGDRAPFFTLKEADGGMVSSQVLLSRGPLVISFYRGVWCPYCNIELQALEEIRPQIESKGASLVAISMQTAPNSRKSKRENKLNFPILVDERGVVASQFGLYYTLSPQMIEVYKTLGNDLDAINGDDSWALPMPGRYVIGQDGAVAYSEVNPDYTHRPEPTDLFPILDRLARSSAA
jgi:peroxiredoxin